MRIAFLHIPKTAGYSLVNAFVAYLGADRCRTFSPTITDADFETASFVSGHVYLNDITPNALRFTMLRDPYAQLASHLRWIDHYNMPEFEAECLALPEDVRRDIAALKGVDFGDVAALARYLRALPERSPLRIRNLQAEMLAFGRSQVTPLSSVALAERAIANRRRLDFIGLVEHVAEDVADLLALLRIPDFPAVGHANRGPSNQTLDTTDPALRAALTPFIEADIILYDHMRERRMRRSMGDR